MTKEEFDKKYVGKKLAVHCPTKGLANEFLKLADSFGHMCGCMGQPIDPLFCDECEEKFSICQQKACN